MTSEPTAQELVEAVREHLETKVLPTLSDHQLRFQTLVATHVLGVVEREVARGEGQAWHQWEELTAFFGRDEMRPETSKALHQRLDELNAELCLAIREGRYDDAPDASWLRTILRMQVEDALALWNPEFLQRVRNDKERR
jgi:hypothetical protein